LIDEIFGNVQLLVVMSLFWIIFFTIWL